MDITQEEQFNKDMWTVLEKIRRHELYWHTKKNPIYFVYSNNSDIKLIEGRMLELLKDWGAIKLLKWQYKDDVTGSDSADLIILRPIFNEIHEKYKILVLGPDKNLGNKTSFSNDNLSKKTGANSGFENKKLSELLYLNGDGDLWREPKQKYCYPMMTAKKRQKLLRYFIDQAKNSSQFIQTKNMASIFNRREQLIRADIGKINAQALLRLKIGHKKKMANGREEIEDGVIEHRQGSGYRLNSKVKVIAK